MSKLNSTDIDAFNCYTGIIRSNHLRYYEVLTENIQSMYKILKDNNYSEVGAIKSIYQALLREVNKDIGSKRSKYFLKPISLTKEEIEKIIEEVKIK